jgi:tape measure domain-containing protein
MGGILGEAKVKISMDDLDKLDRHIDSSGRKFVGQTDKMSAGLKAMGGLFATIGVAKFGTDIFNASVNTDKLHRMLVNVEGSRQAANKRFEEFRKLAKEPVLDPFNLAKYYTGLKAMRVESELSIRFMKGFANVMAGAGAGNEEFSRSMAQIVQMVGKAKAEMQDIRPILEAFPQFAKYFADAMGTIDTEELAKKGVTAIDVLQKLTAEFEKQPHFAGGAQASVDNFKQSLMLFESELGKNVLPIIGSFLDKLTGMMDKFGQLDAPMKTLIGTSVVGGIGLLGVAAAVTAVVNALDALGMSAGLKALTSGALAGGAKAGLGTTAGGIAIGGGALAATMATAGAAIATAWMVDKVYIAATRVDLVGPASTAGAKAEVAGSRAALLKELGLYGETQQFSTGMNAGDLVKMSNMFTQAGLDMSRYAKPDLRLTFADVISSLKTSFGQPKYVTQPMNLKGLGDISGMSPESQKLLEALQESSYNFPVESYASTKAGKYKFGPRITTNELAKGGALGFQPEGGGFKSTPFTVDMKAIQARADLAEANAKLDKQIEQMIPTFTILNNKEQAHIDKLRQQVPLYTDNGVAIEDYNKALEFIKNLKIDEEIHKQNKELSDQLVNIYNVTSAWDDLKKEIGYTAEKTAETDKKQSQFWRDMKSFGVNALDQTLNKSVNNFFDRMNWQMDDTENSWKSFCNNLLAEFTKMLLSMEIEAEAKNVFNWASGKGYGGGGGIGGTVAGLKPEQGNSKLGSMAGIATGIGIWYEIYKGWKDIEASRKEGRAMRSQLESQVSAGQIDPVSAWIAYSSRSGQLGLTGLTEKVQNIRGYAEGGSGIVTKPTMFMMGERGPEAYNIQPLSKGKSGIGGSTVVNISFPNADPDRMDKGRFKHLVATSINELVNDGVLSRSVN